MEIGTATAKPGELTTGYLDVTDLPTGTSERLPVVIARGTEDGPTVWVTAGIHGNEATGVAVAQDVMAASLAKRLRGTIVCLPVLNPAGLRRNRRTSYYHGDDPNRYFPDSDADSTRPPNVQELIDGRIFEAFADSADVLIDLHTAWPRSMPFVIRDRVLYGEGEARRASETRAGEARERRDEAEARELAADLERLVEAFGLPVVNEYGAEEYTEQNLQRSTAGAALNHARIPAFTVELGGHGVVEEAAREAGVVGVYNVLRELDALDGDPEPNDSVPAAPVEFPVKRSVHPHTDTPGIVRHLVDAGDVIVEGDPIAEVVTPHGESKATLRSDNDGYVLGRQGGLAVYENDPVCSLAVRDEEELVVPRDDSE